MKKTILLSLLFLTCAAPVYLRITPILVQNKTGKNSINIAKIVLIENGYMINQINDEIIITETITKFWDRINAALAEKFNLLFLPDDFHYRYHIIINVVNKQNFILYIPLEVKYGHYDEWTSSETMREDLANNIINPLIESFKKRGITANIQKIKNNRIQKIKNNRRDNNEGYFDR